jgi:glyoxylate utilization-related uncharacterized protein
LAGRNSWSAGVRFSDCRFHKIGAQVIQPLLRPGKLIARKILLALATVALLAGCATSSPQVPYPVFVQQIDISYTFLAGFPGARAKVFSADTHSLRSSMMLQIPADWNFSTGAVPDKSVEIYVIEGDLTLGEFELGPGGYAYLPSGSMGVGMSSQKGALLLYFFDDVQPGAVIQTPIIGDSDLLKWEAASDDIGEFGITTKVLRYDPGSGARTWLLKIEPGAVQDWQQASGPQEGFMLSGQYSHNECGATGIVSGEYLDGGYFLRPAGAVNGGPDANAVKTSVWFMRVPFHASYTRDSYCGFEAEQ